jgi:hypothetical protein
MFNLFKKKETVGTIQECYPSDACITCAHVLEEKKPVMYIKRDAEDGAHQFLCGACQHDNSAARVAEIGTIAEMDKMIGGILPLRLGEELQRVDGKRGRGLTIKAFIQDGINSIIEKDIADNKVSRSQLYNSGEIIYMNGRNGTWFDWDVNEQTSPFIVCYNDKKRMGYIRIAIHKDGSASGYKWGNLGKGEAESVYLGNLNSEDTKHLINLLFQQEWDENMVDQPIDSIDWEASVFLQDMDKPSC